MIRIEPDVEWHSDAETIGEPEFVHLVWYKLWTHYIGLDILTQTYTTVDDLFRVKSLFNLSADAIKKFINREPKLYVNVIAKRQLNGRPLLPEIVNVRYLLILSPTFRKAIKKDLLTSEILRDKPILCWKIPKRYYRVLSVLSAIFNAYQANSKPYRKPQVVGMMKWLKVPVMCEDDIFIWKLKL